MFLRFKPNPYTQGKVFKHFIRLNFPKKAYERRFYENQNLVALLLLATVRMMMLGPVKRVSSRFLLKKEYSNRKRMILGIG